MSGGLRKKVAILLMRQPVKTGIQKNCLDTGVRRYDDLTSDTHLCGTVMSRAEAND